MTATQITRSGLNATLLVKHPQTLRLCVNFDVEVLKLVREAKVNILLITVCDYDDDAVVKGSELTSVTLATGVCSSWLHAPGRSETRAAARGIAQEVQR